MLKEIPLTFPSFIFSSSYSSVFLFPLEKSSLKAYPYLNQVFQSGFHSGYSAETVQCQGFQLLPCCQILWSILSPTWLYLSSIWTDYLNLPEILSSLGFWNITLSWFSFNLTGHSVVSFTESSLSSLTSKYWWVPERNSWTPFLLYSFPRLYQQVSLLLSKWWWLLNLYLSLYLLWTPGVHTFFPLPLLCLDVQ